MTCYLFETLLKSLVCPGIVRTKWEFEVLTAVPTKVQVFLNMPPRQSTRRHIPSNLGHYQTMHAQNVAFVDGQGQRNVSHNDVSDWRAHPPTNPGLPRNGLPTCLVLTPPTILFDVLYTSKRKNHVIQRFVCTVHIMNLKMRLLCLVMYDIKETCRI